MFVCRHFFVVVVCRNISTSSSYCQNLVVSIAVVVVVYGVWGLDDQPCWRTCFVV